jgi:hypothetical protein
MVAPTMTKECNGCATHHNHPVLRPQQSVTPITEVTASIGIGADRTKIMKLRHLEQPNATIMAAAAQPVICDRGYGFGGDWRVDMELRYSD